MKPIKVYQQLVERGEIIADDLQTEVMQVLEEIYENLVERYEYRTSKLGKLRRKIKPKSPVKGLYLWGDVGTGKTFLIDLFYDTLPPMKMRKHFHQFMQDIQDRLIKLQGTKNPLQIIAREIGEQTLVICFDEFFVSNITDAMILGELFEELFARGVTLVATSNVDPDELYKNGLQRQRFLPAITSIKVNTRVYHFQSTIDYRLRHIDEAGVYYTPLNTLAEKELEFAFAHFSHKHPVSTETIQLYERPITIVKQADATIWFEYEDIVGRPRSQKDYLEIAKEYHTVLVSNIPILNPKKRDMVVSFINLIDVLYDAHVRLIISAATTVESLYTGEYKAFEFERTKSRLIEMRTPEYYQNPRS